MAVVPGSQKSEELPPDPSAARARIAEVNAAIAEREARAAKDRALATEIGALRKPTRTAWLVNALARDDPDAVGALLATVWWLR